MGRRGPPPKPTKLRIVQGNPSKRPLPENEPKPEPAIPTQPGWLLPEAKHEWSRLAKSLAGLGLLTKIDRGALAACCQAWGRAVEAEKSITKLGMTYATGTGQIKVRPEVYIAQENWRLYRAYCAEFGLTPSSRSRISVPKSAEEDEMGRFLNRGRSG